MSPKVNLKIENATRKDIKTRFKEDKAPEKETFVDPLWWNLNENGKRCLLCYEPMEEKDRIPDHGFSTFCLYINGVRKVGAVHPECYASHCYQMLLHIKRDRAFYNRKCGRKNIDKIIDMGISKFGRDL